MGKLCLRMAAHRAICEPRELLVGDFVGLKPPYGNSWAEDDRCHGGDVAGWLLGSGRKHRLSLL